MIKHPLSLEVELVEKQMEITMEAISELDKTIVTYPNSDAGNYGMIQVIKSMKKFDFIKAFETLPRDIFVNLQRKLLYYLVIPVRVF